MTGINDIGMNVGTEIRFGDIDGPKFADGQGYADDTSM